MLTEELVNKVDVFVRYKDAVLVQQLVDLDEVQATTRNGGKLYYDRLECPKEK